VTVCHRLPIYVLSYSSNRKTTTERVYGWHKSSRYARPELREMRMNLWAWLSRIRVQSHSFVESGEVWCNSSRLLLFTHMGLWIHEGDFQAVASDSDPRSFNLRLLSQLTLTTHRNFGNSASAKLQLLHHPFSQTASRPMSRSMFHQALADDAAC